MNSPTILVILTVVEGVTGSLSQTDDDGIVDPNCTC